MSTVVLENTPEVRQFRSGIAAVGAPSRDTPKQVAAWPRDMEVLSAEPRWPVVAVLMGVAIFAPCFVLRGHLEVGMIAAVAIGLLAALRERLSNRLEEPEARVSPRTLRLGEEL